MLKLKPPHVVEENSRTPAPDPYHYPLRLDNQRIIHRRQYLRYRILSVNRTVISLEFPIFTRNREWARKTHTSTELKFDVTAKFIGLNPDPIPISTQTKHRSFPSPFFVAFLQFTSTDKLPSDHKWGVITFHKLISGLEYATAF